MTRWDVKNYLLHVSMLSGQNPSSILDRETSSVINAYALQGWELVGVTSMNRDGWTEYLLFSF